MKGNTKQQNQPKDGAAPPSNVPQLMRILGATAAFLVISVLIGTYLSYAKESSTTTTGASSIMKTDPNVNNNSDSAATPTPTPAEEAKNDILSSVAERFINVKVNLATSSSTTGAPVVGSITPLLNVFKRFSATSKDLTENIRIETNTQRRPQYAGHHVFASRDMKKGDTVFHIPVRAVFGSGLIDELTSIAKIAMTAEVATAGSELSKIVVAPAINRDRIQSFAALRQNTMKEENREPTTEEFQALAETLPEAPRDEDVELGSIYHLIFALLASAAKGDKFQHPAVATFPALAHVAQTSGLFVSQDEAKYCFNPRAASVANSFKGAMNKVRTITETLCTTRSEEEEELIKEFQASGAAPSEKVKMVAFVRAILCKATTPMLEWAYNVVLTRAQQEGLHRVFVPILDLLPYVGKPNVAVKQSMVTIDGERYIEVAAEDDISSGDALTLGRRVREPVEVLITHGYFDAEVFEAVGIPLIVNFGDAELIDVRKQIERKNRAAQGGREIDSDGDEVESDEEAVTNAATVDGIDGDAAVEKALGHRMSEAVSEGGVGLGCISDINVHTLNPETLSVRDVTMRCAQLQALRNVYPKVRGAALGELRDNFSFITGTLESIKAEGDAKRLEIAEAAIDITKKSLQFTQSVHNRRDFFSAKKGDDESLDSADVESDEEQKKYDSVCDGAKRGLLGEIDAYNGYIVGAVASALEDLESPTFQFA